MLRRLIEQNPRYVPASVFEKSVIPGAWAALSALKKDPWEGIDKVRQSLTKEIMKNLSTESVLAFVMLMPTPWKGTTP